MHLPRLPNIAFRGFLCLSVGLVAPALTKAQDVRPAKAPKPAHENQTAADIIINARRPAERDPTSIGASTYHLGGSALDKRPGGRSVKSALLHTPGVTQDSDNEGGVEIRNEHIGVQYRLNGIIIPESFADFGAPIDGRLAQSIDVIRGALPAEYGLRTAGIVALKTPTGRFDHSADVSVYGSSSPSVQPSATYRDSLGDLNFFISSSYVYNKRGIEPPTADAAVIHDKTEQWRAFSYASYQLNNASLISAFGGSQVGKFQIPNTPGQVAAFRLNGQAALNSAGLHQSQRNQSHFGVLAYQYADGDLSFQVAPFIRYAKVHYIPDLAGGLLLLEGKDSNLIHASVAWGAQADAAFKVADNHTLRFGSYFSRERATTDSVNRVFPVNANGAQLSDLPLVIPVKLALTSQTWSAYLQDEWKLADALTLNYGLRYDRFSAHRTEGQLSPRANLVWQPSEPITFHLGYARNFTSPPLEVVGNGNLAAFENTSGEFDIDVYDAVRAERQHSFDVGVRRTVGGLTLEIDTYLKLAKNLIDVEKFGETMIVTPFNYARSINWGVEFAAQYENGPFNAYLNLARGQQKATRVNSNQFLFAPADVGYIAKHYVYTDHSQKWTISGGAGLDSSDPVGKLTPSFDFDYGSGQRTDDPLHSVPNGGVDPAYLQFNVGIAQTLGDDDDHSPVLRVDVSKNAVLKVQHGPVTRRAQAPNIPRLAISAGLKLPF